MIGARRTDAALPLVTVLKPFSVRHPQAHAWHQKREHVALIVWSQSVEVVHQARRHAQHTMPCLRRGLDTEYKGRAVTAENCPELLASELIEPCQLYKLMQGCESTVTAMPYIGTTLSHLLWVGSSMLLDPEVVRYSTGHRNRHRRTIVRDIAVSTFLHAANL